MPLDSAATIDLKRMRAVVEVARAQSITGAAETLGLTQSAVSREIAEIEQALGVRLFERAPRGLHPTAAGLEFVERARRVFAEVDGLVSGVRSGAAHVAGRLRIGVISTGALAAWAFGAFARAHSAVAVEAVNGSPQALCPQLLHGELDLIVGTSSYLRRWRELEVTLLAPLYFACMFRKDHPLAERKHLSERDVLEQPVILPESIEASYSDLAQRYAELGMPALRPRYVASDFDLACRLVRSSDAFFPVMHLSPSFGGLAADFFLARDVLALPPHHLSVAHAAGRTPSAAALAFEALLVGRHVRPVIRAVS
ncbi:MAG: LysR family transcriptional regulator [Deltaproteobacteria bacterium]|nr:LysR family transcriptional regulator [Deltaproteobacteria bacterium]